MLDHGVRFLVDGFGARWQAEGMLGRDEQI